MQIDRRRALTMSAGALAAIAAPASLRAQQRKVIRYSPWSALRVLDPVTTNSYTTRNHGYMVYDQLFAVDANYRPQPQMVESWEVAPDKLSYRFTLRPGLAFHDGQSVTAQDCIASIERWAKRDAVGTRLAAVTERMTALDERSFRIELKQPFGSIFEAFAKVSSYPLFIMPRRIAETPPERALTEVVGSGPFKFVAADFRPGLSWAYERNETYVPRAEPPSGLTGGKVVKVDRVELTWFPNKDTAIAALRKGEIDIIEAIKADQRSGLADDKAVTLRRRMGPSVSTIRFNWAQPPFNNPDVRRAVQAVATQRDFMDATIGDADSYQICPALFGCGTPLETDAGFVDTGKPDIAKAKELLRKGGYKGERVVMITPSDNAAYAGLAPLTQQILRSIGMNCDLQGIEWSTYLSRRGNAGLVAQGGWNVSNAVLEATDLMSPLGNLNFDARGAAGYTGFVDDPETERLKGAFQAETDPAKQKEIAVAMQQRAYDLVFYIPLGSYFDYEAYRNGVRDFLPAPLAVLWQVEKA